MMESNLPLISVLIPVYNAHRYLNLCLKSIEKQTYFNLEILCVDDGSQDKSLEILQRHAKKDKRIKIFTKKNENSLPKTRNFLLSKVQGTFFCFVDSDDYIEKDYVETMYQNLTKFHSDLSVSNFIFQLYNFPILFHSKKEQYFDSVECLEEMILGKEMTFAVWNKLFVTSKAKDLFFDPNVLYGEDFIYCYKYIKKCQKISYFNGKTYHYMNRPHSQMHLKLGEKNITFLHGLYGLLKDEENISLQCVLKAWIGFTSLLFLFLDKKSKYCDQKLLEELYVNSMENYPFINKVKVTRKEFKTIYKVLKQISHVEHKLNDK